MSDPRSSQPNGAPREQAAGPESSAERVALWRALHVQADPPPHVITDDVGLRLIDPPADWRSRPDMDLDGTSSFRAGIVARARFVEDLVAEQTARGVDQYVILGAGLDTFAQRRSDLTERLHVFEVDQPGPQAWKRRRLIDLGFGVPAGLHFVPVDFEADEPWWDRLVDAGFAPDRPAVVACTGVTMYLTRDAIAATLHRLASLAPGSTVAMTYILPPEGLAADERAGQEDVHRNARAAGTPFLSFFTPDQMHALAHEAGLPHTERVSGADLSARYFADRTDSLRLPSNAEEFMVARV